MFSGRIKSGRVGSVAELQISGSRPVVFFWPAVRPWPTCLTGKPRSVETTQRRTTAQRRRCVPLCAVAWFLRTRETLMGYWSEIWRDLYSHVPFLTPNQY